MADGLGFKVGGFIFAIDGTSVLPFSSASWGFKLPPRKRGKYL